MSSAIFSTEKIVEVKKTDIDELKEKASQAKDRKFRYCLHNSSDNILHQSVIVFCKDAYIPAHKHPLNKPESYHVIEGEMTVYFFDEAGKVSKKIEMGAVETGKTFFYRLATDVWHMPVPKTEHVVFHETNIGPYDRDNDVKFADWGPDMNDREKGLAFVEKIKKKASVDLSPGKKGLI